MSLVRRHSLLCVVALVVITVQTASVDAQSCSAVESLEPALRVDGPCAWDPWHKYFLCDPGATLLLHAPWVLENPSLPSCQQVDWFFSDTAGWVSTKENTIQHSFPDGRGYVTAVISGASRTQGIHSMKGYFYTYVNIDTDPVPHFREDHGPAVIEISRTDARFESSIEYETYHTTPYVVPVSGTLVFAPGELTKTVSIPLVNDNEWKGDRIETILIRNPTNGYALVNTFNGGVATALTKSFEVEEDDAPTLHQCTQQTYSANENAGEATIPIERGGNLNVASTGVVLFKDFIPANEPPWLTVKRFEVAFAPGEATKAVKVPVFDDDLYGPGRFATFICGGIVNGFESLDVLTTKSLVITEDEPEPTITVGNLEVTETDGLTTVNLPVSVAPAYGQHHGVLVIFRPRPGVTGTDVSPASGNIGRGQTSTNIPITIVGDQIVEPTEIYDIQVSSGTQIGTGVLTIHDDDVAPPAFGQSSYTFNENAAVIGIVRSGSPLEVLTAKVIVRPGSGVWTASPNEIEVSLAAGEASKNVTLPLNDAWYLGDRSARVELIVYGSIVSVADVTVHDDEPQPVISIGDVSVREGDEAVFTVTLSSVAGHPIFFEIRAANGTATAGSDYQLLDTTASVPAGALTRTIRVATIADASAEAEETYSVTLRNCCGPLATLGRSTATGTIVDDDSVHEDCAPAARPQPVSLQWNTSGELEVWSLPHISSDLQVTLAARDASIVRVPLLVIIPAGASAHVPLFGLAAGATTIDLTFPETCGGTTLSVPVSVFAPPGRRRSTRH